MEVKESPGTCDWQVNFRISKAKKACPPTNGRGKLENTLILCERLSGPAFEIEAF